MQAATLHDFLHCPQFLKMGLCLESSHNYLLAIDQAQY